MKALVFLKNLRQELKTDFEKRGLDTHDVDYILEEVLHIEFFDLMKDRLLTTDEVNAIMDCVKERRNGKPVTKIFHKAYFYGYEFFVDNNVLSPRSETELLVYEAVQFVKSHDKVRILDLCTGSGAIACAVYKKALEMGKQNDIKIVATDISKDALAVAKRNATALGCSIAFVESDMFANIEGNFDLILSNPPYIETAVCDTLDREVKDYDPMLALDGGADGLDFYRIIKNNLNRLNVGGMCIMEIGYNQGASVSKLFEDFSPEVFKDYSKNDRIVVLKK